MTRSLRRLLLVPLAAGLLIWTPGAAGAQSKEQAAPRASAPPARSAPAPAPPARTAPAAPRASEPARAVPRSEPAARPSSREAASAPPASRVADDQQRARPRSSSGRSTSGERATPRRTAPSGDRGRGNATVRSDRGRGSGNAVTGRAVERARDRGGRPALGTAVARRRPPFSDHRRPIIVHNPWLWYSAPAGFGFYYWDPYWWGYPYAGYYPYGGYYGGGYYGYYSGPSSAYYGSLRLKVKPVEAEVYVDGYFAGHVDDYDGIFQRLHLDVGPHRIEIRHPGYQPISFEVRVQPDQTITYEARMIEP